MKLYRALVFFAFAATASSATSTAWEVSGFADFLKGRLSGLSLTADGALQPGPSARWNTALNQPALWSVAVGPDQSIYAATGHRGEVFKISPDGKSSRIWSSERAEVFALCVDGKGTLYAGSSPDGGVARIEDGKGVEIWHSPDKYIWAIAPAPDGALYVATGEPGRIFRIDSKGKTDLYYETGQANVTTLAVGPNGHLYAGTDPNGLLYDISGPKQGSILYDSTLPEIRAIAFDPNGAIYAAAMGGAVTSRSPAGASTATAAISSTAVVATTPTVITVTDTSENAQAGPKPATDQSKTPGVTTTTPPSAANPAVIEVSGAEKSAIYRINPDHTVETLRSSKEDNVYSLLLDGEDIIFSTDDHGRIYRLNHGKTALIAEPGDGETTRLVKVGSTLFAALSNPARLVAYGPPGTASASYESQIHDGTSVARWGHLQWRGNGAGQVLFRTRTGNAARPDSTWSPWSTPISDPANNLIKSPPARFVQWRAEWPVGSSVQISSVNVPYLPQNTAPAVRSINVASIVGTNPAKTSAAAGSSSSAYSVTVTDTGEPPPASSATSSNQTVSRLQTTQTQISWQADDPDGDKLVYSVYFRAEDQTNWQLIRSRMFENTLLLDPDVLADGRYYFRVVASDAPANAAEFARTAELVSTAVLIDNTPPVITLGTPHRNGASLDIDIEAEDKTSSLRLCEYSLDAGFWQPIESIDGVTDSPHERFHLRLEKLSPGEHLLVFRVRDAANNAGLARIVLH